MNVICAWCGKILKEGSEPTSHGICRKCAWTFSRYYRPPGEHDHETQRFVDIACYVLILAITLLALGLVIWRCR